MPICCNASNDYRIYMDEFHCILSLKLLHIDIGFRSTFFFSYPNLETTTVTIVSYFAASPEVLCDFVSHKPCRFGRERGVSVGQNIVLKQISTLRLELNTTASVVAGGTVSNKGLFEIGGCPLSNFYAMKHGDNVSTHTINQLCRLLQCRVQDVMEYIDEE